MERPWGKGSQERLCSREPGGKAWESAGDVPGSGTPSARAGRPVMSHGGEKAGGRGEAAGWREASRREGPDLERGEEVGALPTHALLAHPALTTIRRNRRGGRVSTPGSAGWGAGAAARSHDRRGAGRGLAGPHVRAASPPQPPRAPLSPGPTPLAAAARPDLPRPLLSRAPNPRVRRRRHVLTAARWLSGFAMTEEPPPPPASTETDTRAWPGGGGVRRPPH